MSSYIDGYHSAYCSWCFEKTTHKLIEQNYLRRNVYECLNEKCKEMNKVDGNESRKKTLQCRVPSCENMARSGDSWDDELCAEHYGSIASFERLSIRLSDIADYKKIFERDSWNVKKITITGLFIVGGAAIIGPVAFAVAPAIGGAVGAALGYSGAVATNVGLATLGGGALAAGGFGMAGGVTILTATGAMLGGTLGGVISNSYFGEIDGFDIELIKKGIGPKIIFIDGFLTEKKPDPSDWTQSLKRIYPNNPWYYLRWESKRLYDLGSQLGGHGANAAATQLLKTWAAQASKAAATKAGPAGAAATVAGLVNNPWSVASVKAAQTGVLLADIISRTSDEYILCGHSLGARVIYYALESLSTKNNCYIDTAHLLGGAVGNHSKDWERASGAVKKVVNNYHSDNDWILATMYKIGTFFSSDPIGRNPILSSDLRLRNHDVSNFVSGHTQHKNNFHKFAQI